MMKLRCLLIDDEPLALDILEGYIEQIPYLSLVSRCSNAITAMEIIETDQVDIIFTDIQMPNLSGLEFSKLIIDKSIKLIFTTAFEEFAIEGYKVNAIDYLVKPISYAEFNSSVNRVKKLILNPLEPTKAIDYIFIKSEHKLIKINLSELIYIEGMKDYIKFYTVNSESPFLTLKSMKSLEEELPDTHFLRIHRSFIVNLNKVTTVERNTVIFGEKRIPVSEKYKESFQKFINSGLNS